MGGTLEWERLLPLRGGDTALSGVTVLAGAGISVDAGLPTAWPLFDEIVGRLVRSEWAAEELCRLARLPRADARDDHDVIRLETLLMWVGRVFDPDLGLFGFVDGFTRPGELHRRLAHGTRRGLHLTTVNFDDLLERALLEQGDLPLTVDAHDGARKARSAGVPVVKFHGTRTTHAKGRTMRPRRSLHATTQIIAATNPGAFLNKRARAVLGHLVNGRTLVVAGYSASDDLDIVPALRASRPARVIWIDHCEAEPRVARLGGAGRGAPLWQSVLVSMRENGVKVKVLRGRTSQVLDALGMTAPNGAEPQRARRQPDWRIAVGSWARSVRLHDPTGLGLAALLFGDMCRYELAERALAESKPSPLPDGRWTAARCSYERAQSALLRMVSDPVAAYALGRQAKQEASGSGDERIAVLADLLLGRAAFLQQDYETARSHFVAARDAVEPTATEWAHAVAWMGRTEIWAGRPRCGMRSLRRAAAVFRRRGELEALLDAVEATGIGRLGLMEIARARPALAEAHELACSLGYVDRRFTSECGLAECAVLSGAMSEAGRSVDEVLALVAASGHDEIADAWALLAEVELARGRFRAAARAARRALETTTVINRKRRCEHTTTLAEAHLLGGHLTAAVRALRDAGLCAPEHTNRLGEAKRDLLGFELAIAPHSRASLSRRGLLPAETVRLARTIQRTGCRTAGAEVVVRRARILLEKVDSNASK